MLNEKTLADIQLKMNDVNYLWHDNFRLDLNKFLDRLSALNQPTLEENYSSFVSVFYKPKTSSGYGLAEEKKATNETALDSNFSTPRPR